MKNLVEGGQIQEWIWSGGRTQNPQKKTNSSEEKAPDLNQKVKLWPDLKEGPFQIKAKPRRSRIALLSYFEEDLGYISHFPLHYFKGMVGEVLNKLKPKTPYLKMDSVLLGDCPT